MSKSDFIFYDANLDDRFGMFYIENDLLGYAGDEVFNLKWKDFAQLVKSTEQYWKPYTEKCINCQWYDYASSTYLHCIHPHQYSTNDNYCCSNFTFRESEA